MVSGDISEADQREAISRRLPDDSTERGQKRSSEDDGDVEDQRESISRRLPDENDQPTPVGRPQPLTPDMVGIIEKKKVTWKTDVEQFEAQAAWGGARRDMSAVRQKMGAIMMSLNSTARQGW